MRTIKFRAWNGKELIQFNFNDIYGYEGEVCGVILPDEETVLCYNSGYAKKGINKDLAIMQFTGLKDKNAKDIYEGDIVNCLHPLTKKFVPYGVVSFENGCFKFSYINDPWNLFMASEIEIIGNIYENPELLKS